MNCLFNENGVFMHPEVIAVPLEERFKAKVIIKLGMSKGEWFYGCQLHVPGARHRQPCSLDNWPYDTRGAAKAAAIEKIVEWLACRPGRKTYKHHDVIAAAVRAL